MDLLRLVRCCLNCGSLFTDKNGFLCKNCWAYANADAAKRKFVRTINHRKISGLCIWNWIPNKNNALSCYLAALKGWTNQHQWKLIAQMLIERRAHLGSPIQFLNPILIPAPSARPQRQDHAWALAKELSRQLGFPMESLLEKTTDQHQRGRSRSQRTSLEIRRCEKFSKFDLSNRTVILVDDVITTGGTLSSAIEALGPMKSHEIWCLAQRALL